MEIESSYWRIESNVVTHNGTAYGGTSGIHFYTGRTTPRPTATTTRSSTTTCRGQQDSTGPDGNGIQTDTFCDGNTVAFNVVWNNAGTGLTLFLGRNNVFVANTVFSNATDRGRLRWPGVYRAEILLVSSQTVCGQLDVNGNCAGTVGVPAGRASNNIVYDNIVYSSQSEVQGIYATADYIDARNGNHCTPTCTTTARAAPTCAGARGSTTAPATSTP